MRIQHNISALNSYRNLNTNNSNLSKNLEKLSSGYAINRAGDDAAGLAISEKMRAQITSLDKAQDNSADAISMIQTAEGALTEVHSMLNRMVELAMQSANGTIADEVDRDNIQAEFDQLIDEIDRIAESTNFNGIAVLATASTDYTAGGSVTFQIGENAEDYNLLEFEVKNMDSASIGVLDGDAVNADSSIASLSSGSTVTAFSGGGVASQSNAQAAIEVIKDAINMVSEHRGTLGAMQNRLEHSINNLSVTEENMTAAESRIRDVDMAEEMMAYTKNNILVQSAQSMLAQANMVPQGVLQLLG